MPVFITDADALDRIMQVECYKMNDQNKKSFRDHQCIEDTYSFEGFRKAHSALSENERGSDQHILVDGNPAIYGTGGYHRYFVRRTGEVVFSLRHSRSDGPERAQAAGFTVV